MMSSLDAKKLIIGAGFAAISILTSFEAQADNGIKKTNLNLAVASNFYGVPPSNSAITDIINEFENENPNYTVTVVDNGATATLESHIINGNALKVDLFFGGRYRYAAGLTCQSLSLGGAL
jgi:ABC-type glycerol-3-phosphate transport system substrate-binding protein